jgi:hypothetical protein
MQLVSNTEGIANSNQVSIFSSQMYIHELKKPVGLQGPKGDKGDQGDPGTGGGASFTYIETMPVCCASSANSYVTLNTSLILQRFTPGGTLSLTTASRIGMLATQTSAGSLRYVIYSTDDTHTTYSRLGYTSVVENPASGDILLNLLDGLVLEGGKPYYIGFLSDQNAPKFAGVFSETLFNNPAIVALQIDNIGSMVPPASISGGSEILVRAFMSLTV